MPLRACVRSVEGVTTVNSRHMTTSGCTPSVCGSSGPTTDWISPGSSIVAEKSGASHDQPTVCLIPFETVDDWSIVLEVMGAVKAALPDANARRPGEVMEHVLSALRAHEAKMIDYTENPSELSSKKPA